MIVPAKPRAIPPRSEAASIVAEPVAAEDQQGTEQAEEVEERLKQQRVRGVHLGGEHGHHSGCEQRGQQSAVTHQHPHQHHVQGRHQRHEQARGGEGVARADGARQQRQRGDQEREAGRLHQHEVAVGEGPIDEAHR